MLELPYDAVGAAIEQHRDGLAGAVLVDIANPADWSTMDRLVTAEESSSAEETATLVPAGTSVVKAVNTTFAPTLAAGEAAGQQLDILLAGDDEEAGRKAAAIVEPAACGRSTWARSSAPASSSSWDCSTSRSRTTSARTSRARSSSTGSRTAGAATSCGSACRLTLV